MSLARAPAGPQGASHACSFRRRASSTSLLRGAQNRETPSPFRHRADGGEEAARRRAVPRAAWATAGWRTPLEGMGCQEKLG